MKQTALITIIILCLAAAAAAQQKPWSSWDKKQVEKMLNESAWGQTQTETDTSAMTYQPTADPRTMGSTSRDAETLASGARNSAMELKYRIRLFSARPIREAFARMVMLSNPNLKADQLKGFISGDYSDSIVVAVAVEATDRRYLGPVMNKLDSATTDTIRNNVFLELGDGKRVFLEEYAKPTTDGTGAKFVFARLDTTGKPLIAPDGQFKFVADLGRGTKIEWRFKLSDMTYDGKLEY